MYAAHTNSAWLTVCVDSGTNKQVGLITRYSLWCTVSVSTWKGISEEGKVAAVAPRGRCVVPVVRVRAIVRFRVNSKALALEYL